jgi:hypothetical protein
MYCPKCGKQSLDEKNYCRACGMNLYPVSELLTGQSVTTISERSATATTGQTDQRRKFLRLGFVLLFGGFILATLLAAIGDSVHALNRNLGNAIENLGSVGAIVMLAGIGVMIYSRFFPASTKTQQPNRDLLPAPKLVQDTASMRPPEGLPSVTEHTTFQLKPPVKENQRQ